MKRIITIVLFLLLTTLSVEAQVNSSVKYMNPTVSQSTEYQEGNIYQKDFLLFVDMLKEAHPAFASAGVYPFDIDSLKQEGYKWSAECQSPAALSSYIQAVLSQLNDGHTTVNINIDRNKMYPLFYLDKNDEFILFAVNKEFEVSLGKTIAQINDVPMQTVLQSFKKGLSFDNEVRMTAQLPGFIRYPSMWESNPYKTDDGSLKLTFTDGSSIALQAAPPAELNLAQITPDGDNVKVIRKKTKQPFNYTLLPDKKICYLQFNSCVDKESMRSQLAMMGLNSEAIDQAVAAIPLFREFLDEMFTTIKTNGISTLVVDVRGNAGGNSMLCDELLRRLKPYNEIKNGAASFRISRLWELNYPQLAERYKHNSTNDVPYALGKLYDNSEGNVLTGAGSNSGTGTGQRIDNNSEIFNGKVIFIQDHETYSSAGMLITNAIDNNIGMVIGSEGSYNPCGYGDMLSWQLPGTGISGAVSHKVFYRPDRDRCHEKTIKPDVELFAYSVLLAGNDDCWEWILNNIPNL